MGHDITWTFRRYDVSSLKAVLVSAPYFKKYDDPYYEYFSPENAGDHPDFIASITQTGLTFTDFGESKICKEVMAFLESRINQSGGAIEEQC